MSYLTDLLKIDIPLINKRVYEKYLNNLNNKGFIKRVKSFSTYEFFMDQITDYEPNFPYNHVWRFMRSAHAVSFQLRYRTAENQNNTEDKRSLESIRKIVCYHNL